ncbi:branched-chain amino acid ABC transporter permease [Rhodospirillaceae bacterium KN72]|uniref:Branched-chain amino acid ABC transporter permease n=1 Tax=Pacificispira spongiicola TaxID=2729598 RepID=A0A7Y0HHE3_9PROT|nr:branched-chain amino acid ABC transporter permease [Pacificispira spongiicola]NMM45817.1 branched-chain amino acid ABC transporter permease [Pacificispira spongiicola]
MIYREAGQFKTSYAADQQMLPIPMDRWFVIAVVVFAAVVVPLIGSQYWLESILIPVLILSIAALGLNILTGYAGQLSLGTGGFMAAGAYMSYKVATNMPDFMPVWVPVLIGGLFAAGIGIVFGLPSLRIKGFYLAVATLAAQFFLIWLFQAVPWFVNDSLSGVPSTPPMAILGYKVTGAEAQPEPKYLFVLAFTIVLAIVARNMARSRIGRSWMAIRDMDIAAELIGIQPLWTKLSAFAISSFYCGVAGALWSFCYINSVEPTAFSINRSFQILFMVIIGGLGSVLGSFLGAAFIFLLPIFLNNVPAWFGLELATDIVTHIEFMVFGGAIIFFLIVEPHGLARLWQIAKEKLRLWPFPH